MLHIRGHCVFPRARAPVYACECMWVCCRGEWEGEERRKEEEEEEREGGSERERERERESIACI